MQARNNTGTVSLEPEAVMTNLLRVPGPEAAQAALEAFAYFDPEQRKRTRCVLALD